MSSYARRRVARVVADQRGLSSGEYVVLLVLVLALAVAAWNVFGNTLLCRFADASSSFSTLGRDDSAAVCDGDTAQRARSSPATPTGAASAATGGASDETTAAAPSEPTAALASAEPSAERGGASDVGQALATAGEHAVDAAEGYVVGVNPLSPLLPAPSPTFGHEQTYGVGMAVGSVHGLAIDAANIGAGVAGLAAESAAVVLSDGTLMPIMTPAMAASAAQVTAGVASAGGHLTNLEKGINYAVHGDNGGSSGAGGSSSSGGGGSGRNTNKLKPDPNAEGAHSTFKRGEDGKVSNYGTYEPNPQNPSGFQETKRVDVTGRPHRNPDGTVVPTPHVKEAGKRGVRPATPEELPR